MILNKKILITGANGLVGQAVCSLLQKKNIKFVGSVKNISESSFSFDVTEMNISCKHSCEHALNKLSPDIIVNTAAFTNVDLCEINKEECWMVNVIGVENLVLYCKSKNIHLVHISSDFVFDGLNGNYLENDVCSPINYYGKTKLCSENIIKENISNYTIIRTSMIYDYNNLEKGFLGWIAKKVNKNQIINIVDDQFRTATNVHDLVMSIFVIINRRKTGVYHISSDDRLSIYDIVCKFVKKNGFDVRLVNKISSEELKVHARRPKDSSLNCQYAIKNLNYKSSNKIKK